MRSVSDIIMLLVPMMWQCNHTQGQSCFQSTDNLVAYTQNSDIENTHPPPTILPMKISFAFFVLLIYLFAAAVTVLKSIDPSSSTGQAQQTPRFCPRRFDGWTCWEPQPAGTIAKNFCPNFVLGFDTNRLAYRV